MFIKKEERKIFYTQVAVWSLLFILPPLSSYIVNRSFDFVFTIVRNSYPALIILALLFFLNLYWIVPEYLYKNKKLKYSLINCGFSILATALICLSEIVNNGNICQLSLSMKLFNIFSKWGFTVAIILFAELVRNSMQQKITQKLLEDERQKRVENELTMLKSQLNPHFLFNTLNNISSLVKIDGDAAQESIGQLSDLLRYTLYFSDKPEMPLDGEIEFMNNYIDLMRLRCNELTDIKVDMQNADPGIEIAPMLFISLIENAFKHGVNSRKKSFVDLALRVEQGTITFTVKNSLFPKPDTDRIGSGIGISNTKHRLDLVYPGRYEYIHEERGNIYFAQIIIKKTI